ncbi:hypothetical protein K435DRAFT_697136, partial [Dendrothele bispora CBS 962.96]
PCPDTGMWRVLPDEDRSGNQMMDVIHLDRHTILRGTHLIGIAGEERLPHGFRHTDSLDAFQAFYVNKYIDHHAQNHILTWH